MRALLLLVLCGCRQLFGFEAVADRDSDGGPPIDQVATDGPTDSPPGAACYGTAPVRICFVDAPANVSVLVGTIDTGSDCPQIMVLGGGLDVCVISAATIQVSTTVFVTGARPLVLVGTQSISVNGVLDASSSGNGNGAGANPAVCGSGATAMQPEGGAGGSFAGRGGSGGSGGAGPPSANALPPLFHGGCAGDDGAQGLTNGGAGGGALYLISDGVISIQGSVLAGGNGGRGGDVQNGGGGGGSGGYVGLDAMEIVIGNAAHVIASGGGGGGGGDLANQGSNGNVPSPGSPSAAGGMGGGSNGGDGGGGGGSPMLAGFAGGSPSGVGVAGGGGGGGAGVIQHFRADPACFPQCVPPDIGP